MVIKKWIAGGEPCRFFLNLSKPGSGLAYKIILTFTVIRMTLKILLHIADRFHGNRSAPPVNTYKEWRRFQLALLYHVQSGGIQYIFARITLLSLLDSVYRSCIEASGSTLHTPHSTHHSVVLLNLFYSVKGLRFRRYELFAFATATHFSGDCFSFSPFFFFVYFLFLLIQTI